MAKNNRKKHTHTIQNRHYITHTSHHQFSQTKNKWECVQRCNVHAVWIRACFIYECLHFFLRLSVCWQSHTMHMYTSNSYELYFWQKKSSVWFWTLTMGRENEKKTLNWTFKWFSVKLLITYSVHICCESREMWKKYHQTFINWSRMSFGRDSRVEITNSSRHMINRLMRHVSAECLLFK